MSIYAVCGFYRRHFNFLFLSTYLSGNRSVFSSTTEKLKWNRIYYLCNSIWLSQKSGIKQRTLNTTPGVFIMQPLFIKYKTSSEKYYVYDIKTGEILNVSETVYSILDDYHILSVDEIIRKYFKIDKRIIVEAIRSLDECQHQGLLLDHYPEYFPKGFNVVSNEKIFTIRDFLQSHRRQLIIEITHKCNLECKYCIYSSNYYFGRSTPSKKISIENIKYCIDEYLSRCRDYAALSFYGGEPLLELDKIVELINYAKLSAKRNNIDVRFSVTTNGTLLTDKAIHIFVTHNVAVFISLDGDKETHDRYRIFSRGKSGSYDIILRNMNRFVALYPNYDNRGIVLTVTATTDISKSESEIKKLRKKYPLFVSNFVVPVADKNRSVYLNMNRGHSSCLDNHCSKSIPDIYDKVEYDSWKDEWYVYFRKRKNVFIDSLCNCNSPEEVQSLCNEYPIISEFVKNRFKRVHARNVVSSFAQSSPVIHISCFPGAVRTYCSMKGDLYPCERCGFNNIFKIGRFDSGLDVEKICQVLINYTIIACDCNNCIYNQLCQLCPSYLVAEYPESAWPDSWMLQKTCKRLSSSKSLIMVLQEYTEIMEKNSNVLDWLCPKSFSNHKYSADWLNDIYIVPDYSKEHLAATEILEEGE